MKAEFDPIFVYLKVNAVWQTRPFIKTAKEAYQSIYNPPIYKYYLYFIAF
jgi:hypothetical protein